ncbi:MAG TPA: hypothetical protein VM938_13200 [Acidimicrobiales bacterium]|nr:hypothetical protein [Acidimicrobiales bacterium]
MTTDHTDDGVLDRMRDAPVGTNDPNIVGDVGPTDVPPGQDPPLGEGPMEDPPTDDAPSLDTMEGPTTYGQPVDPAS